jgi:hypothetical protein
MVHSQQSKAINPSTGIKPLTRSRTSEGKGQKQEAEMLTC